MFPLVLVQDNRLRETRFSSKEEAEEQQYLCSHPLFSILAESGRGEGGWMISKHGIVSANHSVVVGLMEHYDRTRATESNPLSNHNPRS